MVTIKATKCRGDELQPGDLFSTAGPGYWDQFPSRDSVGERVYIRTNVPSCEFVDGDASIYRVEVQRGSDDPMLLLRRCVLAIETVYKQLTSYADVDVDCCLDKDNPRVAIRMGVLDAKELYDAYHAAVNVATQTMEEHNA